MSQSNTTGKVQIRVSTDRLSYPANEDPLAHLLVELVPDFPEPEPEQDKVPVEMVMVLDTSGSMDEPSKYPLVRKAVEVLVQSLDRDDRLSLVLFSHASYTLCRLTGASVLRDRLDHLLRTMDSSSVMFGHQTLMSPGLLAAMDELELNARPQAVQRIYCLTDGELHDPESCMAMIRAIQQTHTDVHIYGFGDGFNVEQLTCLVEGLPGSCVKPLIDTEQVVSTFQHLAGNAAEVVARDLRLTVRFSNELVCGDAFQYRPRELLLGCMDQHQVTVPIGSMERNRVYAYMFEVRLPVGQPGTDLSAGLVTAQYLHGADNTPGLDRCAISFGRTEQPGDSVERVRLIRDLLLGLRESDLESQVARFRAKIELYRAEKRDPALIEALQRQLDVLLNPEHASALSERDKQYIDSVPLTVEMTDFF